jgi:hypothetical protein
VLVEPAEAIPRFNAFERVILRVIRTDRFLFVRSGAT